MGTSGHSNGRGKVDGPFRSFLEVTDNGISSIGGRLPVISLNPYGRGCDFDCLYCIHRRSSCGPAVAANEYAVLNKLRKGMNGSLRESKLRRAFESKAPLYIGAMSECLGPTEESTKGGLTLSVLELLKEYNYRYTIITKNDLIATPNYLKQMNPPRTEVQISVSTPIDYCSRIMEQGAPVTHQRLKVARLLANHGVRVVGRIEPIFPDRPDYFYSLGRRPVDIAPFVYWNNSLVRMIWQAGIQEIHMGIIRPQWPVFTAIEKAFGFNLKPFFKQKTGMGAFLSIDERMHYYDLIKKIAGSFKVFTAIVDPDMEEFK